MYTISTAQSDADLHAILALQKKNLRQYISAEQAASQGFLTAEYSFDYLQLMHQHSAHIVAKDGENVVGYCLALVPELLKDQPVFESYLAAYQQVSWKEKPLNEYAAVLVGQLCVAQEARGKGLVEALYQGFKKEHQQTFKLVLSDVSTKNPRSMRAHERVGFIPIHTFDDAFTQESWTILVWEWAD